MTNIGSSNDQTRILLVEGRNDEIFVDKLLKRLDKQLSFNIKVKNGIDLLIDSLGAELRTPNRSIIGIMVDANAEIGSRWDEIKHRIESIGIHLPQRPMNGGTVTDSNPRVGIWLMPDNHSAGELEDFLREMIPSEDVVWPLAEKFIESIPPSERRFGLTKVVRAQLYAWLSTRENPRFPGTAIEARDLRVDGESVASFLGWLTRLFS